MTSSNSKPLIILSNLVAVLALAAGTLATARAHAHIQTLGNLISRGGDIKHFPCDGKRGDGPIYTFEPGTTITLSVNESIPHPSYFRIAFDDMGEDNFVEPKSIKPIDPLRPCPYDSNDKCGEADYCNVTSTSGSATVLWDNIEPHAQGGIKSYTWTVKLPNVECDNCTIQILQIMEDTVHGAYCPTGSCSDSSLEDIYHVCIDIKLKKGATNSPGATTQPVAVKGMECVKVDGMPAAGSGAMPMAGSGGAAGMLPAAGSLAVAGSGATAGAAAAIAGRGVAGSTSTAGTGMATAGVTGSAGVSAPSLAAPSGGTTGALPGAPVAGVSAAPPVTPPATAVAGTTGTVASPVSSAGTLATAPAAPPPSVKSSGCSVSRSIGSDSSHAYANSSWLLLALAVIARRKRR